MGGGVDCLNNLTQLIQFLTEQLLHYTDSYHPIYSYYGKKSNKWQIMFNRQTLFESQAIIVD